MRLTAVKIVPCMCNELLYTSLLQHRSGQVETLRHRAGDCDGIPGSELLQVRPFLPLLCSLTCCPTTLTRPNIYRKLSFETALEVSYSEFHGAYKDQPIVPKNGSGLCQVLVRTI